MNLVLRFLLLYSHMETLIHVAYYGWSDTKNESERNPARCGQARDTELL